MKITNLPINVTFGEGDGPEWKKHSKIPTAHDEDADMEDEDQDTKDAVKSTLGFDPSELFNDS